MAAPEIDDSRLGIWQTRRKKESAKKHLCAAIVKDTGNIIKLRIKLSNSDIFNTKNENQIDQLCIGMGEGQTRKKGKWLMGRVGEWLG